MTATKTQQTVVHSLTPVKLKLHKNWLQIKVSQIAKMKTTNMPEKLLSGRVIILENDFSKLKQMTHIVITEKQLSEGVGSNKPPRYFHRIAWLFTHSKSEEFSSLFESAIFRSRRWNNTKQTAKARRDLRVISSFF